MKFVEPTEAQKKAGNYQKEHRFQHGMRISIENLKGSIRRGVGKDGKPWESEMQDDYGYIRGTTGKDKDHIDVFHGPDASSKKAFIIDQDDDEGNFDEHKVMIGYPDANEAYHAYHRNYPADHNGFAAMTEMDMDEFKKWAYAGRSGKRKRVSDLVGYKQGGPVTAADCGCGCGGAPGFAEGGSVEDKPYIGFRSAGKRKKNDRENAKDVPVSVARGIVAGTAGLPGDLEGLIKSIRNVLPSGQLGNMLTGIALGEGATARRDSTPALPTSEFYNEWLPGPRGSGPINSAAEKLGNVAGMDPFQVSRAARPVVKALDKGAGALSQAAEAGYRAVEPAIERGVGAVMDRGGLPAQLLQDLAQGSRSQAVKPKGGNWNDAILSDITIPETSFGRADDIPSLKDWMTKQVTKYARNEMGTAADPFLKLEKEGRLHLSNDQVNYAIRGNAYGEATPQYADGNYALVPNGDKFHREQTGRFFRTPWEELSDNQISKTTGNDRYDMLTTALGGDGFGDDLKSIDDVIRNIREISEANGDVPPNLDKIRQQYSWMDRIDPNTPVYHTDIGGLRGMGFDHIGDYLREATDAHAMTLMPPDLAAQLPTAHRWSQMRDRGLVIDPADLSKMTLPQVASKTNEWNKLFAEAARLEELNKGVKSVLKQYPDTGHQWVELSPEGLQAEGSAMRHCVGGYCSSVEGGNTRILSLRDKEGQPRATVELGRQNHSYPENFEEEHFDEIMDRTFEERARRNIDDEDDQATQDLFSEVAKKLYSEKNPNTSVPWDIRQIKGPANRAPSDDVRSMVQDFVKNMGPWGEVRDLENTGLRYLDKPYEVGGGARLDPGYYTEDDFVKGLVDQGIHPDLAKGYSDSYGGSRRYATGGSVNTPTVGLGTFATGDGTQPVQTALPNGGFGGLAGAPGGASTPSTGNFLSQFNPSLAAGSNAPSYNFNDPTSTALFGMGMTAMGHAGRAAQGNQAFLGDDFGYNYNLASVGDSENDNGAAANEAQNAKSTQALLDLAKKFGMDTSGYDTSIGLPTSGKALLDFTKQIQAINNGDTSYKPYDGMRAVGYNSGKGMNQLYADLQNKTKDYMRVRSASAGWDGKNDPRSMADVMYQQTAPGQWVPVSKPKYYKQPEKGSWAQEDGADLIAAASMIMPAFGGWAGALGNGAAGTLTAGGGLGLTGSVAPSLVNAGMGAVLGGNPISALGGLAGGWAGGMAGNALGGYGAAGTTLGSAIGRQAAGALSQSRKSK